jgi:hypothetical protein
MRKLFYDKGYELVEGGEGSHGSLKRRVALL